jgi:hypothetical protein
VLKSPVKVRKWFSNVNMRNPPIIRMRRAFDLLVSDPLEGGVVVETEVASVNDIISTSLLSKIIQRPQVSCNPHTVSLPIFTFSTKVFPIPLTSAIHSTLTLPFCMILPLLGRRGVAPGTGPLGVAPFGR